MTAMQLTRQDHSPRQTAGRPASATARDGERAGVLPAGKPATATAQFQPLDPGVLNETIPAFFIGRNKEGFWVARDVNGRTGGIFLLEGSALSFARERSRPAGCATIYLSERFELDLENRGNPLISRLGSLMRLAAHVRNRWTAFVSRTAKAVERRLGDS